MGGGRGSVPHPSGLHGDCGHTEILCKIRSYFISLLFLPPSCLASRNQLRQEVTLTTNKMATSTFNRVRQQKIGCSSEVASLKVITYCESVCSEQLKHSLN